MDDRMINFSKEEATFTAKIIGSVLSKGINPGAREELRGIIRTKEEYEILMRVYNKLMGYSYEKSFKEKEEVVQIDKKTKKDERRIKTV